MHTDATWHRIQGSWKQFVGSAHEQWGKLTHDELMQINGKREQLLGKIEERYGITKEEAEKQINDWQSQV